MTLPDDLWERIREEASRAALNEPEFAESLHRLILHNASLAEALPALLTERIVQPADEVSRHRVETAYREMLAADRTVAEYVRKDIQACAEIDPACTGFLDPLLFYKGFHALELHRLAHWLWNRGRRHLAKWIQYRNSSVFGIDIHPAARIGWGIFIDHGTGIVIGETSIIGNRVTIYHSVTLGGTGKDTGQRHPQVCDDTVIYASATLLGNIRIGEHSVVAAGSLVLRDVPPRTTVMGARAQREIPANPRLGRRSVESFVDREPLATN